jgi:hypothetical protein
MFMNLSVLTSVAVAAGLAVVPAGRAGEPCFQPSHLLPFPVEQRTVTCYRTETRTELRPVEKVITRQVEQTTIEVIEEKYLVHFWRTEERQKEVMIEEHKLEARQPRTLIVGSENEKREKTLMMPRPGEETRTETVYDLKTVPELVKQRCASGIGLLAPVCDPVTGCVPMIAQKAADCHLSTAIVYHLLPVPRDVKVRVPILDYVPKTETCTVPVPTFKEVPKEQVPVCEYRGKKVSCGSVPVLDVREETRTHRVPVTTYRTVAEKITEMVPCTVEVQVPYEVQVWSPVCPAGK